MDSWKVAKIIPCFMACALLTPSASAAATVDSGHRVANASCQTFGNEGFIDLVDQTTNDAEGLFNESFLFNCSQSGCQLVEGDEPFVCEANSTYTSIITDFYYEANVDVDLVTPAPTNGCASACGPNGVGIYEAIFTTTQPYRMIFDGSTTRSEVTLGWVDPPMGWIAHHFDTEDGPLTFDGVVGPGTFRLHGTTNPGDGAFAFTLTITDPGTSGPPPIPDGASVPGAPLLVAKNGNNLDIQWTPTACAGGAVNIYRGILGDYSQFTGADCARPSTGNLSFGMPSDSWFLVVNTDGGGIDGSYSRNAIGTELNYGNPAVCPAIVSHQPDGTCP